MRPYRTGPIQAMLLQGKKFGKDARRRATPRGMPAQFDISSSAVRTPPSLRIVRPRFLCTSDLRNNAQLVQALFALQSAQGDDAPRDNDRVLAEGLSRGAQSDKPRQDAALRRRGSS